MLSLECAFSLVFWYARLMSGGFAVRLEPVVPPPPHPQEVAEVQIFSITNVRRFARGGFFEKACRRIVVVLLHFWNCLLGLAAGHCCTWFLVVDSE